LEWLGLGRNCLTEESILAAARRRTGLADFRDEDFREPLGILIRSFREDGRLHPFGRLMMRRRLIELVSNRLRIDEDLRRHPEILHEPIRRTLFVTGLPRTGTSLLHNLLSLDPASRPLLTWEAFWPSPPPGAGAKRVDPRIRHARSLVKLMYWLAPQMPVIHALDPEGPDECVSLTFNTFVSPAFTMMANLNGYDVWLAGLSVDQWAVAYRHYRSQLQLLQWQRSADHWILKSPMHLAALDALIATFPDACIVQTHRDPTKVVPSLCSLAAAIRAISTDDLNLSELGPMVARTWAGIVQRATDVRASADAPVLDVHYADLVRDPVATVHRIYDHFGYARSERMDAAMRGWLARDADRKRSRHRYSLEQFGLDRAMIEELFSDYCERYGVAFGSAPS
jgi:hypothetical protein